MFIIHVYIYIYVLNRKLYLLNPNKNKNIVVARAGADDCCRCNGAAGRLAEGRADTYDIREKRIARLTERAKLTHKKALRGREEIANRFWMTGSSHFTGNDSFCS